MGYVMGNERYDRKSPAAHAVHGYRYEIPNSGMEDEEKSKRREEGQVSLPEEKF